MEIITGNITVGITARTIIPTPYTGAKNHCYIGKN